MALLGFAVIVLLSLTVEASMDYMRGQELDLALQYWSSGMMENSSYGTGCSYCGESFYHEPPPDDIMFIPSPPLHPSFQSSLTETFAKKQTEEQCNFCNLFYKEGQLLVNDDGAVENINNRIVALLIAFLMISAVLFFYLVSTRRSKIVASIARARLFKTNQPPNINHPMSKSNSLNETLSNSGVHLSDPCFLQTNRDKNLTNPIINDHAPHKKTAIPSKYWAQPGSIIGRTIRRIPNEYEVPSSRTNSTGTSSAVYADMNIENQQRFFSPYNLHTYAEVREVLDPNEHFHTSSNSSAMLSESNYDSAIYPHASCVINNGGIMTTAPNGSVQMSDFNSMRPVQPMTYGQPTSTNHQHHHHLNQAKLQHNNNPTVYEQPHRAQVIITSNNQGVNPTLLSYKERIHNVI